MKNTKENPTADSFLNYEHETHHNIVETADLITLNLGNELKKFDLDLRLFNILRIINTTPDKTINIKEIHIAMQNKKGNASRQIRILEDRELIERRPSIEDKRVVDVLLTEKGAFVMEELDDLSAEFYSDEFEEFSRDDLETLNQLLEKLHIH